MYGLGLVCAGEKAVAIRPAHLRDRVEADTNPAVPCEGELNVRAAVRARRHQDAEK